MRRDQVAAQNKMRQPMVEIRQRIVGRQQMYEQQGRSENKRIGREELCFQVNDNRLYQRDVISVVLKEKKAQSKSVPTGLSKALADAFSPSPGK